MSRRAGAGRAFVEVTGDVREWLVVALAVYSNVALGAVTTSAVV